MEPTRREAYGQRDSGGLAIDSHSLDMLRWLIGEGSRCTRRRGVMSRGVDPIGFAHVRDVVIHPDG